jgi:GNAT superfamily N-acetyltransferase
MQYTIRKAHLDDREAIEQLIIQSARKLSQADYSAEQIEAAIKAVFGVDTKLIQDGTYFVAEDSGKLIGCGGWSKRKTLFGGDQFGDRDSSELDPQSDPARIRAFFVHPEFARRGIARAILSHCEAEARAKGFRSLELMSTLPGIKLYQACGYAGAERLEHGLSEGVAIQFMVMRKNLA